LFSLDTPTNSFYYHSMARAIKPILPADDLFLIKRVIDEKLYNMENHEFAVIVSHSKGDKDQTCLKNLRAAVRELREAQAKLHKLFEKQYETSL
jgi:hypothetical protein